MAFEVVKKFQGEEGILLPKRSTDNSAGYDFIVAEDIIIPSYHTLMTRMEETFLSSGEPLTLEQVSALTKSLKIKPSLVSTGVKCELEEPNTYLELSVRSSTPLKHWLILANGVGIIDADYYNNPDNEGEIFFQIINLSPFPIQLKKGDRIGQGIIKSYFTMTNDNATGKRQGGFGSTGV